MRKFNFFLIIIIFATSCSTLFTARRNAIAYFTHEYSNKIRLSYQFALSSIEDIADMFYSDFEEAISKEYYDYRYGKMGQRIKVRERLLDTYMPFFENHKDTGLTRLHFHLADGKSFIRFHRPDYFGDNLFESRPSVKTANQQIRFVKGFEIGKIIHGFRFIYPIIYDAHHLGSIGITFDFSAIKKEMEEYSDSTVVLILEKEYIKKIVLPKDQESYSSSIIHNEYYADESSKFLVADQEIIHNFIQDDLNEYHQKMENDKQFSQLVYQNEATHLISFMPIEDINNQTAGYIIALSKPINAPELDYFFYFKILTGAFFMLAIMFYWNSRVKQLNEKLSAQAAELTKLSTTDKLTGLYNRHHGEKILNREFERVTRYKGALSLLMMDIDNFKDINDTKGHQVGDTVLQEFSHTVYNNIRSVDTLVRWGGEEFLLICPETALEDGIRAAENIRQKVASQSFSHVNGVTISIGVGSFQPTDTSLDTIIQRADKALYRSKEGGRNRVSAITDTN